MADALTGQCMCGAARFTATPKSHESGVCHCGMCRKWSGGMMFMVDCAGPVVFDDDTAVTAYASSDWGERVFCKTCGCNLAWRLRDGSHTVVSLMALNTDEQFPVDHQIYIDEKPAIYDLAQKTKTMTGAEVIAMFAPKEGGQ